MGTVPGSYSLPAEPVAKQTPVKAVETEGISKVHAVNALRTLKAGTVKLTTLLSEAGDEIVRLNAQAETLEKFIAGLE